MTVTPFHLDEGLFLERRQVLLPWSKNVEALALVGQPEQNQSHKEIHLSWKQETVLGGLAADIWFRSGRQLFNIEATIGSNSISARDEYATILAHLTSQISPPHISTFNEDVFGNTYPRSVWDFGPVKISLVVGERFMEYVALTVSSESILG